MLTWFMAEDGFKSLLIMIEAPWCTHQRNDANGRWNIKFETANKLNKLNKLNKYIMAISQ